MRTSGENATETGTRVKYVSPPDCNVATFTELRNLNDKSSLYIYDKVNVRFVRQINSPALLEGILLKMITDYYDDVGFISGEVILRTKSSRIPAMLATSNSSDPPAFKDWVKEFSLLRRKFQASCVMQILLSSNEVVQPVLRYLQALKYDLDFPVVMQIVLNIDRFSHINLFKDNVNIHAAQLIDQLNDHALPNLILSFRLQVRRTSKDSKTRRWMKFSWRNTFDLFDLANSAGDRTVFFDLDIENVQLSIYQLSWLLNSKPNYRFLLRWSIGNDQSDLFASTALAKSMTTNGQIFYDLPEQHRHHIFNTLRKMADEVILKQRLFVPSHWQLVHFASDYPSKALITSDGVAFLGHSATLLVDKFNSSQLPFNPDLSLNGKILFVPRTYDYWSKGADRRSTLWIYTQRFEDQPADPFEHHGGVRVAIASDGQIIIENLFLEHEDGKHSYRNHWRWNASTNLNERKEKETTDLKEPRLSSGQLIESSCYDFRLFTSSELIRLNVRPSDCPGDDHEAFYDDYNEADQTFYERTISLPIGRRFLTESPRPGFILQKMGDETVDILLTDLFISSGANPKFSLRGKVISFAILFLFSFMG